MSLPTRVIGVLFFLVAITTPSVWPGAIPNSSGQWQEYPLSPAGRKGHEMEIDPPNLRVVMFGGVGDTYLEDTWVLDYGSAPPSWARIAAEGARPDGRKQFSMIHAESRNSMIVYGGRGQSVYALGDMWELHLELGGEYWEQIFPSGGPPTGSNGQTAVYDPVANRMVMFGGRDDPYNYFNGTWALDLGTLVWTQLSPSGTPPPARANFGSIYDPVGHRMIIFGGESESAYWNDTWALSLTEGTEAWSELPQTGSRPEIRSSFCMEYDAYNQRALLYGGQNWDSYYGFQYFNDVWELDLTSDTWSEAIMGGGAPPLRRNASSALVKHGANTILVLFGGDLWNGGNASDVWLAEF